MFKKPLACAVGLSAVCVSGFMTLHAGAQVIDSVRVASGLSQPCWVGAPAGDFNRVFIIEQKPSSTGRVRVLDITTNPPTLSPTTYLTVSPVATADEQGLLGLAFHPDFLNNGYFWVNYNTSGGTTVIARYRANAPFATSTTANPTATTLLTIAQPFSNHNGGWMGFGPDGYLYISTGDGGSGNDPNGAGQSLSTLLGKMLRIDVDGPDNVPGNADDGPTSYTVPATNPFPGATAPFNTIWAYGLRNPWRCSHDRTTGELYIGDVGQNSGSSQEEISHQPADVAGSMGGRNYGWRCMAGTLCTGLSGCTCNAANLVLPISNYATGSSSRCAVIGGYVYRGSAIPALQGHYFFADYCAAQIYTMQYTGTPNPAVVTRTSDLSPSTNGFAINTITSFGEDAAGEIYICDRGGELFKVVPVPVPPPANDTCAGASLVGNGSSAFNTAAYATDGIDEGTSCGFTAPTQITNDAWYKYLAPCTGTATVSVCGATFDTRIAVYAACPGGAGTALVCNDNACGNASEVSFPVVSGTLYQIRVGGVNGATGTGTIVRSCATPPSCPADFDSSGGVGTADLLQLINAWGPCAGCPQDLDGSNVVGTPDLLQLINAWGPCL